MQLYVRIDEYVTRRTTLQRSVANAECNSKSLPLHYRVAVCLIRCKKTNIIWPHALTVRNKNKNRPSRSRSNASCLARPLQMLRIHRVLVVVHETTRNVLPKHIHLGGGELARRHTLLKEHVHLGERAACWLGHAEVGVDDAQEADTSLNRDERSVIRCDTGRNT